MRSPCPGENPADQARDDIGVVGNERLTALTGAVLLVSFAVEIVTVVLPRAVMPAHFFIGVLLIGPVAVKTASTGWRILRYYTRHPAYRRGTAFAESVGPIAEPEPAEEGGGCSATPPGRCPEHEEVDRVRTLYHFPGAGLVHR